MLGLGAIFLIAPRAYFIAIELEIHAPLSPPMAALMQLDGNKKSPALVFQGKALWATCDVRRCQYDGWINDVNSSVEIRVDKKGMVSGISASGISKIDPADIRDRYKKWLYASLFIVLAGVFMLVKAWSNCAKSR